MRLGAVKNSKIQNGVFYSPLIPLIKVLEYEAFASYLSVFPIPAFR